MSEYEKKVNAFKRGMLDSALLSLRPAQLEVFDKVFGAARPLPDDKLDAALGICERTLKKKKKKNQDAARRVVVKVTVRMVLLVDKGSEVQPALDNMDYTFRSTSEEARITDTEIIDTEILNIPGLPENSSPPVQ